MKCEHLQMPGGGGVIICTRGHRRARCVSCGALASIQCDSPLAGAKKGKTCSRNLCRKCAVPQPELGADRDFCPAHAEASKRATPCGGVHVFTARLGFSDRDVLDITRKSGSALGINFAPSWAILEPALSGMRAGGSVAQDAWDLYVPAYLREMRESYAKAPLAWRGLLSAKRAVLVCYCANAERCHRTILARDILPKLGAVYGGELGGPAPMQAQKGLFDG